MRAPSRSLLSWISTTAALALLAAPGCSGTAVGNPPSAQVTQVKLGVVGTEEVAPQAQQLVGGITLSAAWVALSDIGLRDAKTCGKEDDDDDHDSDSEFDVSEPFAADLLTGMVYPASPEWERASGEHYCALRASLGTSSEPVEGAPAELEGHSVYVRGTRADGTPFELRSDIGEPLSLRAKGKSEFSLEAGEVGLLVSFNLNGWINPTVMNEAQVEDGVIYADKSQNKALAESVEKLIPTSARLVRDRNRNGALDPDDGDL